MKEALLLGDPVDGRLRFELVGLIEYLSQHLPKRRGRPPNDLLRQRAGVVGVLHDRHGMKIELALNLVAQGESEADRARDRASVRECYRKLKASRARVVVPEHLVTRALAKAAK